MDGIQKMVQPTLAHIHRPPAIREIEQRYRASSIQQNKYQFPRKRSSVTSSYTSNSIHGQYYNLYSQNGKVKIQPNTHIRHNANNVESNTKIKSKQKTQILQVKKIIQYAQRSSLQKKQKLKIITNKNSPSRTQSKNNSTQQHINPIMKTPEKTKKNSVQNSKNNSKQRSNSKKKLTVLSAHKLRKIETFKVNQNTRSPRKGLSLLSKQKQKKDNKYGVQVRAIHIF